MTSSRHATPPAVQPLVLETLPLTGYHLIEASAGTGKTFTLAALYVRLVLGPLPGREEHDFPRPLLPPEILVVTFTEAATAELRGRIRARLKEARDWLLAPQETRDDKVLAALLGPLVKAGDDALAGAAKRLDQAARLMDEAAIFTIHGFCQRMLTRHAFDAGARFGAELLQDGSALLTRVVEDYWRCHFYPLAAHWQREIRRRWEGPEALSRALTPLLKEGRAQPLWWDGEYIQAPASLNALLESAERSLAARSELEARLRQAWDREAIAACLQDAFERGALNKRSYKPEELETRLAAFEQWLTTLEAGGDDDTTDSQGRFWLSQAKLEGATKKGHEVPTHAFFALLDELAETATPFDQLAPQVLAHARDTVAAMFAAEKRRQGWWEFGDLLCDLDAALDPDAAPEAALRLAGRIRGALPVALIDEFQDTDPLQYRIFSRIYRAPEVEATTTLLMIGDPKQAIYAFRGADIDTYLAARRETPSRFTLARNFRSSHAMVEAVNTLFARHPEPFGSDEIPFIEVEAQGKSTRLVDADGHDMAALGAWWPGEERHSKADYQTRMASAARAEIQRMLEGGAYFLDNSSDAASGARRPVRPADIAILVRKGAEALAVRRALAEGGIRSVYLSERTSVFDTPLAFELLQLFEAVAQPRQDARLKAALATRLLCDTPATLETLLADELAWEREVERFADYHRQWQRRGVLPMLRAVMRDFRVAERLGQRDDGERALTDLLHLGELAQTVSARLDGEHALLRWWHRALLEGAAELDAEAVSQRLESDEDLVKVITIHKAKGLEYPIVLLPFVCDYRPATPDRGTGLLEWRDPQEGRVWVHGADDTQLAAAEQARLDEDVRLLYVALTRAAHACRLGVAQLGRGRGASSCLHETALGRLLGCQADDDGHALRERLAAALNVEALPEPPDHRLRLGGTSPEMAPARRFTGGIDDDWWIASYSALIVDARLETGGSAQALPWDAPATLDVEVSRERDPVPRPAARTLRDFPRGPRPGTFLHGLLEAVDFDRLSEPAYRDELQRLVSTRLHLGGFDAEWAPVLLDWLCQALPAPFAGHQGAAIRLDGLAAWRAELEFWLPAEDAWSTPLDALVCALEPLPTPRPRLAPRKLNGMLKGFIDLVFEAEDGRWYVLDWKSNHLGDALDDYHHEALAEAMVAHRYDLQYVLYVLALHRLLKARLEDYDYDTHMGGACYVFLRGFDGTPGHGVFQRRPERRLIEALDAWLAGDAAPVETLRREHGVAAPETAPGENA
ncbi:exodeoxyribonuclease V subunit beta [Chromohalobacter sp. HP20-39]|uniref:exodeoxyribonuclease V subunit beta n=1 Tax=Chromohalobacter sp. HP20-39 TaxID=3079306 RepID=UPI00294B0D3C|nr:exodeoxyribonuclease V subunit beta [Chromohalobacter sp. HP20-39]MDV6319551.1 exodeoxyribonuclease V subunit beta [Chromohalobacter sp. HP20-39]